MRQTTFDILAASCAFQTYSKGFLPAKISLVSKEAIQTPFTLICLSFMFV